MSSPGVANHGARLIATTVTVSVLASTAVALRLATRIWIVRSVGWDDYTIICAAFGIVIATGLVIVQVHYGFGRHKTDLSHWQFIEFMKYSYGEWIQTFQTLMFTKISVCLFLLRIPVERYLIRPIQGAIVFLIVTNITLTFIWIFQCNPIARAWNTQVPGHCLSNGQLQRIIISQAIISIISDFLLALFPIVLLWKVQISSQIKAGICTLMALGLMYEFSRHPCGLIADLSGLRSTAALCMVRTILNWQNVNSDPTWISIPAWYWRAWEVCIGIVAACIPALRPGYQLVSTSIATYMSHRSLRMSSDPILGDKNKTPQARPGQSRDPALLATAGAISTEADRAKEYGSGEEGFAMRASPGDKQTADQGIKKTTRIDIGTSTRESQGSLDLGDPERGLGNRIFL